jgi:ribosomal protein S18 acetylase RimI-like enzyme
MNIRVAKISDIPILLPLWKEALLYHQAMSPLFAPAPFNDFAFIEYLESLLKRENLRLFISHDGSEINGFIVVHLSNRPNAFKITKSASITDAFVSERYRKMGIGKQLANACKMFAKENNIEAITLSVAYQNPNGFLFWQKMGFEIFAQQMVYLKGT